MAIHWDYDQIARSYRYYHGQQGRPNALTPDQVRRDIQGHRALWNDILAVGSHVNARSAYLALRDVLEGRQTREAVTYRRLQYASPEADFFEGFVRSGRLGLVPKWLLDEARHHLTYVAEHQGSEHAPDVVPASFSLWLAIHAYEDEGLTFVKKRLRTRWRIAGDYYTWLLQLLEAERGLRQDVLRSLQSDEWTEHAANRRFGNPLGPRDPAGYAADRLRTYQLPLEDYKTDLGELARLLGGLPDSERWQEWAEAWLWDFPESTVPAGLPDHLTRLGAELRRWWSTPTAPSLRGRKLDQDGHLLLPDHCLLIAPSSRPDVAGLTIRLTSRWVSLNTYPRELQEPLYLHMLSLWHRYEEPRGPKELVTDLESLLEPITSPEDALVALWREEAVLKRLSIREQERREQQARNTARKTLQRRASFLTGP